jgi:PAS domain-containing protein
MRSVGAQIGTFLERRLANEKVRKSEARKAAILEASLEAVITIDHQGQVVEFNSAAETLFGYPASTLSGASCSAWWSRCAAGSGLRRLRPLPDYRRDGASREALQDLRDAIRRL